MIIDQLNSNTLEPYLCGSQHNNGNSISCMSAGREFPQGKSHIIILVHCTSKRLEISNLHRPSPSNDTARRTANTDAHVV